MKISTWAEATGIVAVVLSLIFVGFEIRQSNDIAAVAIQSEIAADKNEFHRVLVADDHVASLMVKMQNPDSEFTDLELRRMQSVVFHWLSRWYSVHVAYERGIIDDELLATQIADVRQASTRHPAAIPMMQRSLRDMGLAELALFEPIFSTHAAP